jgi:hypothetical protein
MNDSATEYLPQRRKAFDVVPSQDPLTATILQARREAVTDADLSDGAKILFVLLLDWSLWPGKNKRPGVVTISTTKLHELLCRSKRAIYDWKKELLEKGMIWITLHFLPNCNPMHTFHISAIDPEEHGGEPVTPDGLWGNGQRRQGFENPGIGARGNTQRLLRADRNILCGKKQHLLQEGKTSIPQQNAPGSRTKQPLSVAKFATGSRTICDGEPQSLRRAVAESATGSRTKQHLPAAKNNTCQSNKTAPIRETLGRDLSLSEDLGSTPPSNSPLEDWIKGLKNRKPQLLPRELQDIKTKLLEDRRKTYGVQARLFINSKIKAVDELMYGPTPPEDPKPTRLAPKAPAMPPEEAKRRWEAAKKNLPPNLKQKVAAGTAA